MFCTESLLGILSGKSSVASIGEEYFSIVALREYSEYNEY